MVIGGRMYFDDYNRPHCPGVKKAIDEYLVKVSDIITGLEVKVTTMGQALIQF